MKLERLSRGAVVLVAFPFADLSATKVRPALVLSSREIHRRQRETILAAISSVVPKRAPPTSVILDTCEPGFADTGLRVTSIVHCGKLVTVEGKLVLKCLGQLNASAIDRINEALDRAVGLGG